MILNCYLITQINIRILGKDDYLVQSKGPFVLSNSQRLQIYGHLLLSKRRKNYQYNLYLGTKYSYEMEFYYRSRRVYKDTVYSLLSVRVFYVTHRLVDLKQSYSSTNFLRTLVSGFLSKKL